MPLTRAMIFGKSLVLAGVLALSAFAFTPGSAEAKGTHFVLELNTGLGESAYERGDLGLAYGASFGFTWKFSGAPIRFALLATVAGRNATIDGSYQGIEYASDRRDLDMYLAQRLAIPIVGMLRFYGEAGVGQRIRTETLRLSADLGTLNSASNELLVVFAAGLQARLSEHFSLGLRGELMPLTSDPSLSSVAHLTPTTARTALMAQIGVHF
jgi:hypothetical protein